jgi:hypothetical protein
VSCPRAIPTRTELDRDEPVNRIAASNVARGLGVCRRCAEELRAVSFARAVSDLHGLFGSTSSAGHCSRLAAIEPQPLFQRGYYAREANTNPAPLGDVDLPAVFERLGPVSASGSPHCSNIVKLVDSVKGRWNPVRSRRSAIDGITTHRGSRSTPELNSNGAFNNRVALYRAVIGVHPDAVLAAV